MENLMLEKFPELEFPLVKKNIPSISNRGYGSSLDDYYHTKMKMVKLGLKNLMVETFTKIPNGKLMIN